MRVLISKADGEVNWHFEAAYSDDDRDLSLLDLREHQQTTPDRHFEVQYAADHAFEALTAHENRD